MCGILTDARVTFGPRGGVFALEIGGTPGEEAGLLFTSFTRSKNGVMELTGRL